MLKKKKKRIEIIIKEEDHTLLHHDLHHRNLTLLQIQIHHQLSMALGLVLFVVDEG